DAGQRCLASGEDAAAVSEFECLSQFRGDEALFAAEVDWHTGAVQYGGDDAGVAGGLADGLDREWLPGVVEIAGAVPGAELVQADGDLQPGFAGWFSGLLGM